ncbi:TrbC/VirB2 family protein [Pseudoxanthomonas winnipegensis]|uniref:TrbC/VirB2 family protein n=1 Tax=Pseudoxanthomonas winnipegensis TaxID=2480810 RepID=UPI002577862D|nr:TrbC/VirB2 family protein [Pseudoxanthomonas winnipegensis]WJI16839.1 TrbC/VirB2 family protein [Pseudoxanthomonas winnipegensis]
MEKQGKLISTQTTATCKSMLKSAILLGAVLALPAFAQNNGYGDTADSVCGFFGSVNNILTIASIAVVTIAVIFAGYQIAFAHKRIGDVAPILIGGLLIGAAGQIAAMVMPKNENSSKCMTTGATASMIVLPVEQVR